MTRPWPVAALATAVAMTACGGSQPSSMVAYEESSQAGGGAPGAAPEAPGPQPQPTAEPERPAPAPAPDAEAALPAHARAILEAHNRVRAQHCARPLTWSDDLARTAQDWATSLRDNGCGFEHSDTAYGENLAAGTDLSPENAVELWYQEASKYSFKRPGFSMATGHFTQMVWLATRSIGCGFSECQGMRLWVCHYDPPGNVLSLFPDNVLPTTCK